MHEWVDTLRQKLREMKILSPKENLYSKLPEIRAPLLPTRDPTSPLPAPPPVPAAIVPGIERIVTTSQTQVVSSSSATPQTVPSSSTNGQQRNGQILTDSNASENSQQTTSITTSIMSTSLATPSITTNIPPTTAMSNTLTQNLINMLSNPVSAYSHQLSNISSDTSSNSLEDSFFFEDDEDEITIGVSQHLLSGTSESRVTESTPKVKKELFQRSDNNISSLARTFADNVLADPNTCPIASTSSNVRLGSDDASPAIDPGNFITFFVYGQFDVFFFFIVETSSIDSATSSVFKEEPIVIPR